MQARRAGPLDALTVERLQRLGGRALLDRLGRLFLDLVPERLDGIRASIAAADGRRAADLAHAMRSSAVALGAVELAERAAEIERLAEEPRAQARSLPRFEGACRRVVRFLEDELAASADERPDAPPPGAPE